MKRSKKYRINKRDIVRGLILAIITAVVTFIYTSLQDDTFAFTSAYFMGILKVALMAFIGYIIKNYWEKFLQGKEKNGAPALDTKQLPEKLVDKYINLANKRFYLRPKYILKKLLAIRSLHQLWRQAKIAKDFLLE